MEVEEDLIEQKEPTKRFVLKKPIRLAILVLLYLSICVQAMTMTIFNVANTSIRAEIRITEKTHAIFNFIYRLCHFLRRRSARNQDFSTLNLLLDFSRRIDL